MFEILRVSGSGRLMKKILFALLPLLPFCAPAAPAKIPVMLLDGESGGPYHAWQETTPYLKRILTDTGLFDVDVVTAPPKDGDFSAFHPDWAKYQVVVSNYDVPDARWSDDLKASFEKYVRGGGGFV